MSWSIDGLMIMKLGIAALLGLMLGIEREVKQKPVGMKTSLVISVTACLLTVVSIESSFRYAEPYIRQMDPHRLSAQIVSGIGFLGAGVILRRSNEKISGLTTAAIIWSAAGIGIAVGSGFYVEAIVVTLLVVLSVELIPFVIKKVGPQTLKMTQLHIRIRIEDNADLTKVLKEIKSLKIQVKSVKIKDMDSGRSMYLEAMGTKGKYVTDFYQDIKSLEGVISAEIEGS